MTKIKSAALFDFDKTIISHDTGLEFILYGLKRNWLRILIALVISPIAGLFFCHGRFRFIGNSMFLWLATCGLSKRQTVNLRKQFINHYLHAINVKIFNDAILKIQQHKENNHDVFIVSGSSTWMIKSILKNINIENVIIIASTEKRFLTGMVAPKHCFSTNKIKMLGEIIDIDSYNQLTGYSDSASDIPMLILCDKKHLVNPNKINLSKFEKRFNHNYVVLYWS